MLTWYWAILHPGVAADVLLLDPRARTLPHQSREGEPGGRRDGDRRAQAELDIARSIASSTRSMKPVSGLHSGELARITSSMPLGRKNTLVCWTKLPFSKLQKPPFA